MKNKYRKIWVEWVDSSSYDSIWYHLDDATKKAKEDAMICENVGYLIYEDDLKITLSESLSFHNGEVNSVHGIFNIPIVVIQDWRWI